MSTEIIEIFNSDHNMDLMNTFRDYANSECFTDVQLISQEGRKVYAHKMILVSMSHLLKDILSNIRETGDPVTIHLPDVSYRTLRLVVNLLYVGSMPLNTGEVDNFKSAIALLGIELQVKTPSTAKGSKQSGPTNLVQEPGPVKNVQQNVPLQTAPVVGSGFKPLQQQNSLGMLVGLLSDGNQILIPKEAVTFTELAVNKGNCMLTQAQAQASCSSTSGDLRQQQLQMRPAQYNTVPTNFIGQITNTLTNQLQIPTSCSNLAVTGLARAAQPMQQIDTSSYIGIAGQINQFQTQHKSESVPLKIISTHSLAPVSGQSSDIIDLSADDEQPTVAHPQSCTPTRSRLKRSDQPLPGPAAKKLSTLQPTNIIDLDNIDDQ